MKKIVLSVLVRLLSTSIRLINRLGFEVDTFGGISIMLKPDSPIRLYWIPKSGKLHTRKQLIADADARKQKEKVCQN